MQDDLFPVAPESPGYAPTSPAQSVADLDDVVDKDDQDEVMTTLILAGANPEQARTYAAAVRGNSNVTPTFVEFYGRGNIMKEANKARRCLNVRGIHALDLHTFRPDGKTWDSKLLPC